MVELLGYLQTHKRVTLALDFVSKHGTNKRKQNKPLNHKEGTSPWFCKSLIFFSLYYFYFARAKTHFEIIVRTCSFSNSFKISWYILLQKDEEG